MKPYSEYKSSGLEWIGNIPNHWGIYYIKRGITLLTDYDANGSFSTIKDNVNRVEDEDSKYAWLVRATDLEQSSKLSFGNQDLIWVDRKAYHYLRKSSIIGGELLVAKRGEIGKVYIIPKLNFPATLGPNTYLVRFINEKIISKYAYYFFQTPIGISQLKIRNKSTTIGAIYKDDFKDILFLYPQISEQESIYKYLDKKTSQIDNLIDKEYHLIELLQEEKTAVINEAVTRGLNPDVKMKDSGIPWLGEIPEHWSISQIKRGITLLTDYDANGSFSTIKDNVNRVDQENLKYAWLVRATDLAQNTKISFDNHELVWVDKSTYEFLSKSSLFGGELLVAKRGEIGKVYIIPPLEFPATLGPNTYLVRFNEKEIIPRYAYYLFQTDFGLIQLKMRNKSTTIGAIYKDDFKDILFLYPQHFEQEKIADFLDQKTSEIDNLINKKLHLIEMLQEYRSAIISEAVTGKIDVRDINISE